MTLLITEVRAPSILFPRVRADHLPEGADYADTGCAFFSSCLRCPLARCIEEEPERFTPVQFSAALRDREIALLRSRHRAPVAMLAQYYGLTLRHVQRILKRHGAVRPTRRRKRRAKGAAPASGLA